jgi:hypothetical protein
MTPGFLPSLPRFPVEALSDKTGDSGRVYDFLAFLKFGKTPPAARVNNLAFIRGKPGLGQDRALGKTEKK